jgi:hypothetical protein
MSRPGLYTCDLCEHGCTVYVYRPRKPEDALEPWDEGRLAGVICLRDHRPRKYRRPWFAESPMYARRCADYTPADPPPVWQEVEDRP